MAVGHLPGSCKRVFVCSLWTQRSYDIFEKIIRGRIDHDDGILMRGR